MRSYTWRASRRVLSALEPSNQAAASPVSSMAAAGSLVPTAMSMASSGVLSAAALAVVHGRSTASCSQPSELRKSSEFRKSSAQITRGTAASTSAAVARSGHPLHVHAPEFVPNVRCDAFKTITPLTSLL
jgi:hypothetical protein